ncbi:flagellar biosynthetic protein FliR, partial [Candidatus Dependentiae bacterium]|nr:flagellar biosynthetic protein FliR [Candidatus Dependentiae bacterium]
NPDINATAYLVNVVNQIIIGVIIGLTAQIFYLIFQVSGQFYTIQIGFGMINTLDPLSQTEIAILGTFQGIIGMIIFLLISGHHFIIYAIVKSFSYFPLYSLKLSGFTVEILTIAVTKMFYLGFMFAIPLIGIIFIMTMLLGLLAKIAPQMNLLMLGFPLNILVGLTVLLMLQALLLESSKEIFVYMMDYINQFLNYAKNKA